MPSRLWLAFAYAIVLLLVGLGFALPAGAQQPPPTNGFTVSVAYSGTATSSANSLYAGSRQCYVGASQYTLPVNGTLNLANVPNNPTSTTSGGLSANLRLY